MLHGTWLLSSKLRDDLADTAIQLLCPRAFDMLFLPVAAEVQAGNSEAAAVTSGLSTESSGLSTESSGLSTEFADEVADVGAQILYWSCTCTAEQVGRGRHSTATEDGKCIPDVCGECNAPALKLGRRAVANLLSFALGQVHSSYVAGNTQ